ncbi:Transmembrane channel-like protein 3 [Gossypium arboreum]|uniref:Transmembrane channel-like protein 3 n=1 Tax=Gossypium arboreum TaxID=29729 RepID=A0A0B0P0J0_GOSAR|nr:Transmembrane channel-like protein 3 [Gossypium arboreum]
MQITSNITMQSYKINICIIAPRHLYHIFIHHLTILLLYRGLNPRVKNIPVQSTHSTTLTTCHFHLEYPSTLLELYPLNTSEYNLDTRNTCI